MSYLLSVLVLLAALLPDPVYGSELCSMMGGKCQDACTSDQYAESGVFEDCGEKQECCVQKTPSAPATRSDGAPGKQEERAGVREKESNK